MLEAEDRINIEERLAWRRLKGRGLTRGGWYSPEKKKEIESFGTYCTGPIKSSGYWGRDDLTFFYCFNGEAPALSSDPNSELKGGALSLKWLKYMVGELSPCPGVVAKIENLDDLERINAEGGFIISDYKNLNAGELCFFLITQRFCQEQNDRGEQWEFFVEEGIDPRIAFVMAHSFKWTPAQKVHFNGSASHSGFHDLPQWWAKNYYEGKWRGNSHLVGVADDKYGYGKQVGLGRPGASIGLKHPLRTEDMLNSWDHPKGWGFFDVVPGMDYKEVLERIIEDVNRKDEVEE